MLAIGAVVNTSTPVITPVAAHAESAAAATTTDVKGAGDSIDKIRIWNGDKLDDSSKIALVDTAPAHKAAQKLLSSAEVEQDVEAYFADIPVMVRIARCESQFRQYDSNGEVLRGVVNTLDRGVMQINEGYHGQKALSLGDDLMTIDGNMAYARYLYEKQGTRPWMSSSACWSAPESHQIAANI